MKNKIIVTGGSGYIGSHTVVELLEKNYEVVIIDNLSNSYKFIVDNIEKITSKKAYFYKADLCNLSETEPIIREHSNAQAIIHFAALKSVGESVEMPLKYYQNNIISLLNLIDLMYKYKISNLVFSSSCTVYGQPDVLPVTENSPLKEPLSPYGHTKRISEDIIKNVAEKYNINSILLRYFNPIGAHNSALIGELPIGIPNNLVPYITQTAIGKREYLRVFGNDYNTPDGTPIRDYIHVVDLAKAHIISTERLIEKKNESKVEIFNLGTGKGYSVLEVIKTFIKVTGCELKYKFHDRRPGDIEKVWADTSLANKVLKWKAQHTLEEMLESAWKWEKYLTTIKIE